MLRTAAAGAAPDVLKADAARLNSPVRGLSPQEVDDLQNGRGAGYARMAELNSQRGLHPSNDVRGRCAGARLPPRARAGYPYRVLAEVLPEMKAAEVKRVQEAGRVVAMVGDGINDAPALAQAEIGISLSDATKVAMQSANVILSNNQLSSLPKAIKLGRYTYQTIKQNLFWAFFYNVLAIPLAAMGYLSPIWAAMVMAFSDVILVLNSLRLNFRKID